jgi:hypothetical protein
MAVAKEWRAAVAGQATTVAGRLSRRLGFRTLNPNHRPYIGRGGAASPGPDWRPEPRLQPARSRASPSAFAGPHAWPVRWAAPDQLAGSPAWLAGPSSGWLLAWDSFYFRFVPRIVFLYHFSTSSTLVN